MAELDIYGDLDNFDANIELDKRKEELESAKSEWHGLSEQLAELLEKNQKLEDALLANKFNFKTVLHTVRLELQRKDSQIVSLESEKQHIIQRRVYNNKVAALSTRTVSAEPSGPPLKGKKRFTNTLPLEELIGRPLPEVKEELLTPPRPEIRDEERPPQRDRREQSQSNGRGNAPRRDKGLVCDRKNPRRNSPSRNVRHFRDVDRQQRDNMEEGRQRNRSMDRDKRTTREWDEERQQKGNMEQGRNRNRSMERDQRTTREWDEGRSHRGSRERSPRRSERSPRRSERSPRRSERSPRRSERSPRRSKRSPRRSERSPRRQRSPESRKRPVKRSRNDSRDGSRDNYPRK